MAVEEGRVLPQNQLQAARPLHISYNTVHLIALDCIAVASTHIIQRSTLWIALCYSYGTKSSALYTYRTTQCIAFHCELHCATCPIHIWYTLFRTYMIMCIAMHFDFSLYSHIRTYIIQLTAYICILHCLAPLWDVSHCKIFTLLSPNAKIFEIVVIQFWR